MTRVSALDRPDGPPRRRARCWLRENLLAKPATNSEDKDDHRRRLRAFSESMKILKARNRGPKTERQLVSLQVLAAEKAFALIHRPTFQMPVGQNLRNDHDGHRDLKKTSLYSLPLEQQKGGGLGS